MSQRAINDLGKTLFLGVDIGTETCKTVLLQVERVLDGDYKYEILEAHSMSSNQATERSRILNVDKTVEMLATIIEKTTQGHTGEIYTSFTIHDASLRSKNNRVRNPFSMHERIITQQDVDLALKMAGNAHIENEREYLHVMPRGFYVNDKEVHEGPVGLVGTSLDAEVLLVSVMRNSIKQIVHCSNEVDYPCNFICATPFATGEAVLTKKERTDGALVIDFGAGITSATLFQHNMPKAMTILPLAGNDITKDISEVLKIPLKHAELLKKKHGIVDREYLSMYEANIRMEINQQIIEIGLEDVYKVVKARTAEIIGLLKQQLFTTNQPFPYPIVVTGGSARILGLKQLIENAFKNTVRIAQPWNWGGPYEIYRDPSFSSVIGVCIAGLQHYELNGWMNFIDEDSHSNSANNKSKLFFKKIYSSMSHKFKNFLSLGDVD